MSLYAILIAGFGEPNTMIGWVLMDLVCIFIGTSILIGIYLIPYLFLRKFLNL